MKQGNDTWVPKFKVGNKVKTVVHSKDIPQEVEGTIIELRIGAYLCKWQNGPWPVTLESEGDLSPCK